MRLLFFLLFASSVCNGQRKNDWTKAVINIEGQHSKYSLNQINDSLFVAQKEGRIKNNDDEKSVLLRLISQKNTLSGSAVYVLYNKNEYLISAKHVLVDPTISNYLIQNVSIRTPLDMYLSGAVNNSVINTNKFKSVISDSLDLCVISLKDSQSVNLRSLLKQGGYAPVIIDDKDLSLESKVGDDINAIGFPDISTIQRLPRWNTLQASNIVVPVTTFGKISMFHPKLPFFYADITIYPGNSGGPIISNGKLIGIVSQQVKIPTSIVDKSGAELNLDIYSRGSLAVIIKANHLLKLLKQLELK
ncbi:MAG: serine protease [Ferruginibacter sp.]